MTITTKTVTRYCTEDGNEYATLDAALKADAKQALFDALAAVNKKHSESTLATVANAVVDSHALLLPILTAYQDALLAAAAASRLCARAYHRDVASGENPHLGTNAAFAREWSRVWTSARKTVLGKLHTPDVHFSDTPFDGESGS